MPFYNFSQLYNETLFAVWNQVDQALSEIQTDVLPHCAMIGSSTEYN